MIDAYETLKAIRASWWISSDLPTNIVLDCNNKFIGVITHKIPGHLLNLRLPASLPVPIKLHEPRQCVFLPYVHFDYIGDFALKISCEENCTIDDVNCFWPITAPVPSHLIFNIIECEMQRRLRRDLQTIIALCQFNDPGEPS